MEKIKERITVENILCMFIISCPILDMVSFIFRNTFNTNISPSTFIRPIIPIILIMYIFFKDKIKLQLIFGFLIYLIYGLVHLYLFNIVKTQSSYSNIIHEAQYIINYSFMILNLFIFIYIFKNKETDKLKKSILFSCMIYIISIYISIITKTSSSTYIERIGFKGWFESGNSISSILILSLFIILNIFKDKKYRQIVIILVILTGIFLTTLIGTRVGLFGFILVLGVYLTSEIFVSIVNKTKISKKKIVIILIGISVLVILIGVIGGATFERRKHLKDIEQNIVEQKDGEIVEAHISGDLMKIKEQIDEGLIDSSYLSIPAQKSIIDLYNYANEHKFVNNDLRRQQMIYNIFLAKNQASFSLILFGNGYMANFRELVLEMEGLSFILNFGLIGFILYFLPFILIFIYSAYIGLKNIKKIDTEYLMLIAGLFCSFALSFLSGYTFFNSSSMIVIVTVCVLLLLKTQKLKSK